MRITLSTQADIPSLLALLRASTFEKVPPEERSSKGFVQGRLDAASLEKMQQDLGIFTARVDGVIAGLACTSRMGLFHGGPIAEAGRIVLAKRRDLAPEDIFQYGPVVVAERFRGRGLLTALLTHICSTFRTRFKKGLAFVQEDNRISISIHLHYFGREFDSFSLNDAYYRIFLFTPDAVLNGRRGNSKAG